LIRAENLTKEYKGFKAVHNLNLRVEKGEIYGFLGPNGAGKTTTILMLLQILKPTAGKLYLFGQDLAQSGLKIKTRIGVVSENQYLYKEMTAQEYLQFFAFLYRVAEPAKRIDWLLEDLGLIAVKNKKLGAFSHGMQQKIGFARALLHEPELLVLDEPISGLDPTGIKQVRDLIARQNKKGTTIFISSHLLSEVEKLCGKVGIIHQGTLLAEERMETLKRRISDVVELEVELPEIRQDVMDSLSKFEFVRGIKREKNFLHIKVKADQDYRGRISRTISEKGGTVLGIQVKEMSLEDAFMAITQKNISLLASATEKS